MKKNFVSITLILFGTLLLCTGFVYLLQRYYPISYAQRAVNNQPLTDSNNKHLKPVSIEIESLFIALPIEPSKIDNNRWEASDQGVSYLQTSPIPGTQGNTIMYGHNYPRLLGGLSKIKPGDEIVITMSDNSKIIYRVEYTQKITPDQTHILSKSDYPKLTLYTCDGFLDSKRFVVIAKLLKYINQPDDTF